MQYVTEYDATNISDTRPRKNMITMGKVDASDLMMIITWAINISFQSPELKWVSWTHTTPYTLMTKVIERTSSMLDTPPQDKLYRCLQVFNACEHSCIMMLMGGSKMSETEYDLKVIYILPMRAGERGQFMFMRGTQALMQGSDHMLTKWGNTPTRHTSTEKYTMLTQFSVAISRPQWANSVTPGRFEWNFRYVIFR